MTGNGNPTGDHTTYKNGNSGDGSLLFCPHEKKDRIHQASTTRDWMAEKI
jgi:hypothetical protein